MAQLNQIPWGIRVAILAGTAIVLYFILRWLNKKITTRHENLQNKVDSYRQTVTMLIIDKKKMRMNDAGFPEFVVKQMPKYSHIMKYPVVKAKVGSQIRSFITDKEVFKQIPVRREIKADVSGLYITNVVSVRGKSIAPEAKKEGRLDRLLRKGRGEI